MQFSLSPLIPSDSNGEKLELFNFLFNNLIDRASESNSYYQETYLAFPEDMIQDGDKTEAKETNDWSIALLIIISSCSICSICTVFICIYKKRLG
jgi:hypothetical protein